MTVPDHRHAIELMAERDSLRAQLAQQRLAVAVRDERIRVLAEVLNVVLDDLMYADHGRVIDIASAALAKEGVK